LRDVDQLSLLPEQSHRKIISQPVNLAHLPLLRNTAKALEYACQLADVVPKEIYPHMKRDKTTWSRICSGEWDLDGRDIPTFCRVVNNDAYYLYLGHAIGYDPASFRKRMDDKDRENHELRQQLAERDKTIEHLLSAALNLRNR